MSRLFFPAGFILAASNVLAHEAEGLGAVHWHATDTAGIAFVIVAAGLAFWLSRGD